MDAASPDQSEKLEAHPHLAPRLALSLDISVLVLGHVNERARTGIHRFIENLFQGLVNCADVDLNLVCRSDHLQQFVRHFLASRPDIRSRFEVSDISKVQPGVLLHSPYYYLPELSSVGPRVLTVHDLIRIKFPQFFEDSVDNTFIKIIENLDANDFITVNSEATKADLCTYAPHLFPDRIVVTPLAADPTVFFPCVDILERNRVYEKYHLIPSDGYLLSVATLEPRKNIAHLIRAFVRLLYEDKISNLKLILVGTKGWKFNEIFDELSVAGEIRDRIVLTGYVPDSDMSALYSNAIAFAYPSLYEGFGLPLLEAMQCGTPVITADNSSLPEVVGTAGILVPAQDEDALVAALRILYFDESLRRDMSRRGIARAATFTWARCVEQTVATYRMAYAHWQSESVGRLQRAIVVRGESLGRALVHHQAGELNLAEAIYKNLLQSSPEDFVALHMLGVLYFQRNDLATAEALLTRALVINDITPEAHYNLGNVYAGLGRRGDSRICYERALELNCNFLPAYQQLMVLGFR
jgi:glycosyltransferase involved in cell wall biosynthesis